MGDRKGVDLGKVNEIRRRQPFWVRAHYPKWIEVELGARWVYNGPRLILGGWVLQSLWQAFVGWRNC